MKLPFRFALAVGAALLECTAQTPAARPGRLVNLSIRTTAGRDADTLIVGFAIGGTTGTKPVLVRGIGPALAQFGVGGTLDDPVIAMFRGDTRIADNDDWGGNAAIASAATATGAFPLGATGRDAAMVTSLAPGSYSVQLTGKGSATGTALAEIYDASGAAGEAATASRLINVSARTRVNAGGDPLTTGFVIGGDTECTVLIRAIGPALAGFGVTGALADPKLELFSGATKLSENDNWSGTGALSRAFTAVGAFGLEANSKDAALLVTLRPGNYTAQVTGAGGTSGVALVEVYAVPQQDPFELLDSFLAMDSTIAGRSPDVTLAVGRDDMFIARNSAVALWQKPAGGVPGRMLASSALSTFFASVVKSGDRLSDPYALFDAEAGRYFFVNAAFNTCPDCGAHLLAVSKSGAPKTLTGQDWFFYRLDRSLERLGTGTIKTSYNGDYDRLAIVGDRLFISWEAIDHDQKIGYDTLVRVLDKRDLMAGRSLDNWLDLATGFDARPRMAFLPEARDRSAGTARAFLEVGNNPSGDWIIGAVEGLDTGVLALSSQTVKTGSSYVQDTISVQPGEARPIFSDLHLSVQPIYRAGRLWVFEPRGLSASDPRAIMVWRELDVSGWPAIRVVQGGVFAEAGVSIVAPAATLDPAGNLVIVYTRVGAGEFPSIYYTGRMAGDPPNTLRPGRLLRAGTRSFDIQPENGVLPRNSFIDFGTAALDPVDGSVWLISLVPSPGGLPAGRNEQSDAWIGRVRPLSVSP